VKKNDYKIPLSIMEDFLGFHNGYFFSLVPYAIIT